MWGDTLKGHPNLMPVLLGLLKGESSMAKEAMRVRTEVRMSEGCKRHTTVRHEPISCRFGSA